MYPLAAGINYHELSGSKPSQFVLLPLQKYETSLTGLKVKRSAGPVPSRGPEGRMFPGFPGSRARPCSSAASPSLHLQGALHSGLGFSLRQVFSAD